MQHSNEASSHGPALVRYSTEPEELVGHVLDGRYRIEEVLGRGAMGLVLGARHVFLDRPVAVKVLHPTLLLMDETRERFLREARAASQVDHEAVVSVSDFGVTPEGLHYLVMEYLEGADLYAYTEAHGALPARAAAHIGVQVCDALVAIHAAGWVHRDLKPENIWVVAGSPADAPRVKVIDLGIAAVMDAARTGVGGRLTRTGHTVGTVHYMSPEQALAEEVDGRSDLYSLGCILWELVTGQCTFDGTSQMAVMMKHMSEAPQPPSSVAPGVPKWFDTVTLRCLAKKREHRFPSAAAARDALAAGLEAAPAGRLPDTLESRVAPRSEPAPALAETGTASALVLPRQRRWPVLVALAAGLAALIVWAASGHDEPASLTPPPVDDAQLAGEPLAPPPTEAKAPTEAAPVGAPPSEKVTAAAPEEPAVSPEEPAAAPSSAAEVAPPSDVDAPLVTLRFDVAPAGAEVSRDGKVLGKTPLALEVPRADEEHLYTVSMPGRETRTLTVSHARDVTLTRTLVALRRPTGAAPKATSAAPPATPPKEATRPAATTAKPTTTSPSDPPTGLMRPTLPGGGGE